MIYNIKNAYNIGSPSSICWACHPYWWSWETFKDKPEFTLISPSPPNNCFYIPTRSSTRKSQVNRFNFFFSSYFLVPGRLQFTGIVEVKICAFLFTFKSLQLELWEKIKIKIFLGKNKKGDNYFIKDLRTGSYYNNILKTLSFMYSLMHIKHIYFTRHRRSQLT